MIADAAFMAVLGLAALLAAIITQSARPSSRSYLQFAAVIYLALAVADEIAIVLPGSATSAFADAVTFVACALAPVALSLSLFATFEHPPKSWIATLFLSLALVCAIGAAMTGVEVLSFAPLSASVFAMLALSLRRWRIEQRGPLHAIIAASCFLVAAASGASGGAAGRTGLALFSAAGILGISLALARRSNATVAQKRTKDLRFTAIGGQG
jgi:hypothetical protein